MNEKEHQQPAPQQLRDKPVPPVKGAVVDREDVRIWPQCGMGKHAVSDFENTIRLDGWI